MTLEYPTNLDKFDIQRQTSNRSNYHWRSTHFHLYRFFFLKELAKFRYISGALFPHYKVLFNEKLNKTSFSILNQIDCLNLSFYTRIKTLRTLDTFAIEISLKKNKQLEQCLNLSYKKLFLIKLGQLLSNELAHRTTHSSNHIGMKSSSHRGYQILSIQQQI